MSTSEDGFSFQSGIKRSPYGIAEIEPGWVHENRDRMRVVDVREHHEWESPLGGIAYAERVPMGQLSEAIPTWSKSEPIAIMCRSGNRSGQVAQVMEKMGFSSVASVRGGMLLWNQLRLPNING